MGHKGEKHLTLFRFLVDTTEAQPLAIVKLLDTGQIRGVLEAIYNVLRGTCPIRDKVKKSLYQKKKLTRRLVSKELSCHQQCLLVKDREVFPLLLKPVVDYLSKKE